MNENVEINDMRTIGEFRGVSFSNFKKSEVKKALIEALNNNKFEQSCYWCAELICAGHFLEIWEIIIFFMGKHIHLGNPKLPIYLEMRFNHFKEIMVNGYIDREINMRNNDKIRKLFAEIMCILCDSNKKHSFENLKIKPEEYEISYMKTKLKAPNVEFVTQLFKKDDPKELFISLNEFSYQISNKNSLLACYWIEWILEFDVICKRKKEDLIAERRTFCPVDEKFQKDTIWILWEIIMDKIPEENKLQAKIINKLLELFCIRYTIGVKKKRKFLMFFAISLLCENFKEDIPFIQNKNLVQGMVDKINNIYKQIKKNEVSPDTDYLFANVDQRETQRNIAKIEAMNEIFKI